MDSRSFTTISSYHNAVWLGKILGLPYNGRPNQIDLCGTTHAVELKSRLRDWYPSWTINSDQITEYPVACPKRELFWAFMLYETTRTIPTLKSTSFPRCLINREVWLMPWDWARQFPVHHPPTGPYTYVRSKHLPNGQYFQRHVKQANNQQGVLHVPKNSSLEALL